MSVSLFKASDPFEVDGYRIRHVPTKEGSQTTKAQGATKSEMEGKYFRGDRKPNPKRLRFFL